MPTPNHDRIAGGSHASHSSSTDLPTRDLPSDHRPSHGLSSHDLSASDLQPNSPTRERPQQTSVQASAIEETREDNMLRSVQEPPRPAKVSPDELGPAGYPMGYLEDPFADLAPAPKPKSPTTRDEDVTAGLDRLEAGAVNRKPRFNPMSILGPLGAIALLLFGWQLLVWSGVKPTWALPPLKDIGSAIWGSITSGQAAEAMWTSLRRGVTGFALALALGTIIGIVVARVGWLRTCVKPLLSAMQSLPSVAWVPFAVMMFYLTDMTIYLVILLSAVPSIAMGLIGGLDQVPPLLSRAGRTLGANRVQLVRHVLLPAALPTYLTGAKQGWAFAWRSLMAAELIVQSPKLGFGLGSMLNQAQSNSDMPTVMASLVFVLLVGLLVDVAVFSPLEHLVLRRRGMNPAGL